MRWAWLLVLLAACAPTPAVEPARTDDPRIAQLQDERANLELQMRLLSQRVADRDALAAQVQTLQADAAKLPTFVMWNTQLTLMRGTDLLLGLPDTFTVRIAFNATTPVRVRIMDIPQYVAYRNGRAFDALTYPATTSLDVTFHDAEGCASYVAVFDAQQESIISPNVTITRIGPDRGPTGACAH